MHDYAPAMGTRERPLTLEGAMNFPLYGRIGFTELNVIEAIKPPDRTFLRLVLPRRLLEDLARPLDQIPHAVQVFVADSNRSPSSAFEGSNYDRSVTALARTLDKISIKIYAYRGAKVVIDLEKRPSPFRGGPKFLLRHDIACGDDGRIEVSPMDLDTYRRVFPRPAAVLV